MSDFGGGCTECGDGRETPLRSALPARHLLHSTPSPFHWILGKAVLRGYCQGHGETCLTASECPWLFRGFGARLSDPAG